MRIPRLDMPTRDDPLMVPIFTGRKRVEYVIGVAIWATALIYFWQWWILDAVHTHLLGSILVSALLAWITILPVYFITIFFNARKPAGPLRIPAGSRSVSFAWPEYLS